MISTEVADQDMYSAVFLEESALFPAQFKTSFRLFGWVAVLGVGVGQDRVAQRNSTC